MKVLPPRTLPPPEPFTRRHQPRPAADPAGYRPCLRWDFGFTCAFCLLHEADYFFGQPGEGLGVMTVEHRVLRRDDPGLTGTYSNCLYCCRLCNLARGTRAIETSEARLLDPTENAWKEHFEAVGNDLRPRAGDANAAYTHRTYDLDDERKRARRQKRRQLLEDRLELLRRIETELAELLDLAAELRKLDPGAFEEAWAEIVDLRDDARRAYEDLALYPAIPVDAPTACRCPPPGALELPRGLEHQYPTVDRRGR